MFLSLTAVFVRKQSRGFVSPCTFLSLFLFAFQMFCAAPDDFGAFIGCFHWLLMWENNLDNVFVRGWCMCACVCVWVMDLIWDSVRGDNRFQLLLFIHYQHSWISLHPLCLHLWLSFLFFSSIFCSLMCSRHSHADHMPVLMPAVSKAEAPFCWLALFSNFCLLNNSAHTYVAALPLRTVGVLLLTYMHCSKKESRDCITSV